MNGSGRDREPHGEAHTECCGDRHDQADHEEPVHRRPHPSLDHLERSPDDQDAVAPTPHDEVYRLGVIAWCTLAARLPDAPHPGPLPDHLHPALRDAVAHAVALSASERTPSAAAFAEALRDAASQAERDRLQPRISDAAQRGLLIGAVALFGVVTGAWALWGG